MNDTAPEVQLDVTDFSDRLRTYSTDGARAVRARSRVYVSVQGETLLQNLAFRHDRPYQQWRPLVEQELRKQGISYERLVWSQKAGCSCGCSPAFILYNRWSSGTGHDYWVTLTATAPQVTEEGVERANDRVAQVLADPTLAPLLAPEPERTYTMADFDTARVTS